MFVCVASLSQPSSSVNVKCLCVLSRCRDLLMLNDGVCVVSLPQPSSRDLLMLNVCVLSRCLSPVVETRDVKCMCVLSCCSAQ